MSDASSTTLIPGLHPRPLNVDEYRALAPEKIELLDGWVFGTPDYPEERVKAIRTVLINIGLLEVVRHAPAELWREALDRAYGLGKES